MDNTPELVAPEQTENIAPEAAQETPEVAEPETAEQTQEQEASESEEAKSLKRMERRIARLTAARYEAAAQAKQAQAEAEAIRQRLAQYEQPQEGQQQIRPEDVLTLAERIAAAKVERETVVKTVQSVLKEGKALEGFDAACNAVNEELPFYTDKGEPTPFLRVVMESDAPAKVLHYLGTNPDVAAELAGMSPTQVARRIARIETQLSEPPAPKVSKAPKPVTPVRATSKDDGGLSPDLPVEEWARRFRESMSKRY